MLCVTATGSAVRRVCRSHTMSKAGSRFLIPPVIACHQKTNGSTHVEQAERPTFHLEATVRTIFGITLLQVVRNQCQVVSASQIPGGCLICMAMCGNGAKTHFVILTRLMQTWTKIPVLSAAGRLTTARLSTTDVPIAIVTRRISGISISDFVSLERPESRHHSGKGQVRRLTCSGPAAEQAASIHSGSPRGSLARRRTRNGLKTSIILLHAVSDASQPVMLSAGWPEIGGRGACLGWDLLRFLRFRMTSATVEYVARSSAAVADAAFWICVSRRRRDTLCGNRQRSGLEDWWEWSDRHVRRWRAIPRQPW